MIYNDFKGEKLSGLGLGCMRLPIKDGKQGREFDGDVDIELTEEMVDYAISHGINYFDTAWIYHSEKSESIIGSILKNYPRDTFNLATKFPGFSEEYFKDPAKIFETQLEKCQVDHFDFYLFHNVAEQSVDGFMNKDFGTAEYLIEQKKNGRIRHLGFSTHGSMETMQRFFDAYGDELEFCQIQLNYMDWIYQDAKAKVDMINGWGIPVWVMEPVRGGKLATLPAGMEARLKAARPEETVPGWAFRFLQGIPGVTMVLSGMSDMQQLKDNIATWEERKPLSDAENELLLGVTREILDSATVPCTACRYCVDHCPIGLEIPKLIRIYNECMIAGKGTFVPNMGVKHLKPEESPANCIGCGSCASACPQQIQIPDIMADFASHI